MGFRTGFAFAALALATLASTAAVAGQPGPIAAPSEESWQHKRSGVTVPAAIGDMKRTEISDFSKAQVNISVQYQSDSALTTVYLYRPHWNDVGVWFDRGEWAVGASKAALDPVPVGDQPTPIARPGQTVMTGLLRHYRMGNGQFKASSLAMLPVGGWLMKIRYSSTSDDIDAAQAAVDQILNAITFPAGLPEGQAVGSIAPCVDKIKWKKAKIIREDMMGALLNSALFPSLMEKGAFAAPDGSQLCKLDTGNAPYALYRDQKNKDKYWMPVSDSGALAQVMQVKTEFGGNQYWSVLTYNDDHILLPAFTQIPEPDLWFNVVMSGQSRATVHVDPDAPEGTKPETTINITT